MDTAPADSGHDSPGEQHQLAGHLIYLGTKKRRGFAAALFLVQQLVKPF
jgi:hypothetical protein